MLQSGYSYSFRYVPETGQVYGVSDLNCEVFWINPLSDLSLSGICDKSSSLSLLVVPQLTELNIIELAQI